MKRINILLGFIGMAALLTGGFSSDVYAQNNANAVYFAQQQKTADSIIILKQTSKFELIPVKNVWVTGINPAGLVDVPVGNNKGFSYVESYFNYNKGKFVKYYESSNSNNYGFKTESYTRVKKVAMHGLLEYSNFHGNNMTFSGVINPERLTNFIADTVPSAKRQECYTVAGGVAFNATPWLALGGSARFESSNLAKMRDLRHETTYAHIDVNFGAKYVSDYAEVGATYFYKKYNERVQYSQISDDNKIFIGYWFKGLFFNLHDAWDADNLYMDDQFFIDKYNGMSGQFELKLDDKANGKWRLYNEFSFYRRRGQTGEGGQSLYSKSLGKTFNYTGKLSYDNGAFADYLTVVSEYGRIYNNDEIYNYETVNGIRHVVNYGQIQVFTKRTYDFTLDYRMTIGKGGKRTFNPSWDIDMGYNYHSAFSNSSFIQPYYFTQTIKYNDFYLNARKNFLFNCGMIDLYAGGKWFHGWGELLDEHTSSTFKGNVAEGGEPVPNYYLLVREFEYYTCNKALYNCGLRYTAFLKGKLNGNLYFDVSYTHLHGKNIAAAAGSNSGMFMARVGLSF